MDLKDVMLLVPKLGDGLSWIVQKIIMFISRYGIDITPLQSQIILIIIFGIAIYIILSVLTIAKKILKWGLVVLFIFLLISVSSSIFV